MLARGAWLVVVGFVLVVAMAASCSSNSASVGGGCSINSDCESSLVCVFGRCHNQCVESRDCPSGQRCVASTSGGVCQVPAESSCAPGFLCQSSQVCGPDLQCRLACTTAGGCVMGDYCLTTGATGACYSASNSVDEPDLEMAGVLSGDGAVIRDGSVVVVGDGSGVSSLGPDGSSTSIGPADDGGGSDVTSVNTCVSAQTQFGNTVQGDSNPGFTSGVGARAGSALLIFSGYSASGADGGTIGDGGASVDAGFVNLVYVQAFDASTARSLGPAEPLFSAPSGAGFVLESAAVAPTGQIAIAFSYGGPYAFEAGGSSQAALYAAFLGPSVDAGEAGLSLQRTVALENGPITGQPHIIWSASMGAFVFSWEYLNVNAWFVGTKNFLPDGEAAGGADPVPTDTPGDNVHNYQYGLEQGSVAAGPNFLGMAFQSDSNLAPMLTILDLSGNAVGSPVQIAPINNSIGWQTVAAVADGLVYLYSNGNAVSERFVAISGDAGAASLDASDAGLSGFTFAGIGALDVHAISDDVSGPGGVGAAMLYPDGLSFSYVDADGATHVGPSSVIAHTYAPGDVFNISNFRGSFVVSLYSAATQSTQVAASGCP
jgi:hypothetical protein